MSSLQVPHLSQQEIKEGIHLAEASSRKRFARILHNAGDEFNEVFNFIMHDSYMQPHLHPGEEKIEHIHLIEGRVAVLFFGDHGDVEQCTILETGGVHSIEVPSFTWHTYVMLSDYVVTYETMMGVYNPKTWKHFADWAPQEGGQECAKYLRTLKEAANDMKST